MKILNYIIVLLLVFLLAFTAKSQTKTIVLTKEIIENDSGICKIDKNISVNISIINKSIQIKEDNIYQNYSILKRKVIAVFEDDMILDTYYGLNNGLIVNLAINPDFGNIMQVDISYDDGKTYYYYKLN